MSLWRGLLGRFDIGHHDNFFELGGNSLMAVEMAMAVERDFEVELSVAEVFEYPTVHDLARRIGQRDRSPVPRYRHLFPIQPRGGGVPFIVAVPHFFTEMFATRFRAERPVYGLRGVSQRPEGNRGRWPTMKHLGEELVEEIDRRFPGSACIVAGYSFGASMAVETVRQMEARGIEVQALYLIAPMAVDIYRLGPLRLQIDELDKPIGELSAAEVLRRYLSVNHPFSRRLYQRIWRRLAIEPWRRFLCRLGQLRTMVGLPLTDRLLFADIRVERFRLHARYRPGLVRTPTFIFNAVEADTDAAATWRPFFAGPLTVIETPDPHLGDDSAEAARQVILEHLKGMDAP
jgi:acyl carrier protein